MYAKLYKTALDNNADIASCDFNRVIIKNSLTVKKPYLLDNNSISEACKKADKEQLLVNILSKGGYPVTKIYKRQLLLNNNLLFPEKIRYEDLAWNPLPFMYAEKYCHIPEPLYNYYINLNSTTLETDSLHHFERLDTLKLFINECRERELYNNYKNFIDYYFIVHYYANSIAAIFKKFSKPDFEKIIEIQNYVHENFPDYINQPCSRWFTNDEKLLMSLTDKNPYEAFEFYKNNT